MKSTNALEFDNPDDLSRFLGSSAGIEQEVWGYVRVSSRKQEREGLSLAGQRDVIRAYCKTNGLPAPAFVIEAAGAGKPLLEVHLPGVSETSGGEGADDRPLLALLLSALTHRGALGRHLVLWKLDRLSRHGTEQEMLLNLLHRASTQLHSTMSGEKSTLEGDLQDPTRVLMRHVLGAVAQYERYMIQQRMHLGRRTKAARGNWVTGPPPHGYTVTNKDLQIDVREAHEVCAVYYLRKRGYSYGEIERELPRRFNIAPFTKMKISRILGREDLYMGIYHDPYGGMHKRKDLRILPEDWKLWAEENDPQYLANSNEGFFHG